MKQEIETKCIECYCKSPMFKQEIIKYNFKGEICRARFDKGTNEFIVINPMISLKNCPYFMSKSTTPTGTKIPMNIEFNSI